MNLLPWLLLLLAEAAAHAEQQDACASDPSACRLTGPAGKASSGAATAATIQGGPISAAQTYTVSGSLTFKLDDDPARSSGNMFDFSATGNVLQDAAFNQALPSGPPGPFGNEDSPDDIPIDELVEFGTDFLTRDNAVRPTLTPTLAAAVTPLAPTFGPTIPFAAVQLQVLVDVAKTGSVSITTQRLEGSMPRSDLFGTLTLTSTLYEGATSIEPVLPQKRVQLEAVLDSSFVIEGSDVDAQAAALPSDKAASAAASLRQAVRPAQTSSPTLDDQTGTLTVLLSASDFSSTQQTKEFQVALAPCVGVTGVCCANRAPKTGGICSTAPAGSCQLDSECDGVSADCPAPRIKPFGTPCSRSTPPGTCQLRNVCDGVSGDCPAPGNKRYGTPCPWSPRGAYLMGEAADVTSSKVMAVSAQDAAAWLTGQPAYDSEWPECEGKCINGACALRADHPACCFVRPRGSYGGSRGRPYAAEGEQDVSARSMGYWKSRDWYCWK